MAEKKKSQFRFRQSFFHHQQPGLAQLRPALSSKSTAQWWTRCRESTMLKRWLRGGPCVVCLVVVVVFFSAKNRPPKNPGEKLATFFFWSTKKGGCWSWILGGIPQPEEFRPWILPPQVFSLPNPFIFLSGQFCIEKSGKVKEVERIINIIAAASSSSSNHHFSSSNPTNLKEFSGNKKMQKIP